MRRVRRMRGMRSVGRMRRVRGVGGMRRVRRVGRMLSDHFQALPRFFEYKLRRQPMLAARFDHLRIVFGWGDKIRGSNYRSGIAESDAATE